MVKRLMVVLATIVAVLSLTTSANAVVITDGGHPHSSTKCSKHNRCVTIYEQVSVVGGKIAADGSFICHDGSTPRRVMKCEYATGIHLELFIDNGTLFTEMWAPACPFDKCPPGSYGFSTAHSTPPFHRNWFATLELSAVGLYQGDELTIWDATSNSGIWP